MQHARSLSCLPLISLLEWISTTCSSDVSSMPLSGSSYELNGTPPLFKTITPYSRVQVVHFGKSFSLNPFNSRLISHPSPTNVRVPAGLTFHLAEIYLEELEKAISASDSPIPVPILALLSPFISLAAHTPTNTTYKHLEESLFRPLLVGLQPRTSNPQKRTRLSGPQCPTVLSNACADVPCTDTPMPHNTLREAILQKLFAVASAEDTRDSNRRRMYSLYKTAVEDDDSVR